MSDKVIIQIKTPDGDVTKEVVWSEMDLEELLYFYLDLGFEDARLEYRERDGWDPAWYKRQPTFEDMDWWYEWKKKNEGKEIPSWHIERRIKHAKESTEQN
jgi:hypothetical protein